MINEIKNNDMTEAMKADVAVVDFNATWCGPCRMLGPVLREISDDMAGKVAFYGCDVDDNDELAMRFGVRNIPTVLFIKDGQVVDKQIGAAPLAMLEEKIQKIL